MDISDSTCLVCHETIEIFAIGVCDHAICFKCSTRLRALCEQHYCPICRRDLPEVFFMSQRESFGKMPMKSFIQNRKLKIQFENQEIRDKFEELLEHRCKTCKNRYPEKSFRALKEHMSRVHTLFYCNLCLDLKIFTSERKLYTRQDLGIHRRLGDKDDTSYKGHPLCEFCDERYLDKDELYKHLRKDHYFCHFCESQGSQDFFDNYEVLRQHFGKEHFLCEEGECVNAKFENAFRSKIDMQSHMLTHHGKDKTKQQSKQERTINIDINLVPRQSNRGRGNMNGLDYEENRRGGARYQGGRGGKYKRNNEREDRDMERALQASLTTMKDHKAKKREPEPVKEVEEEKPNLQDVQNFPSLGGDVPTSVQSNESDISRASLAGRVALAHNMSVQHGVLGQEDFPDLRQRGSSLHSAPPSQNANTSLKKPQSGNRYSSAAVHANVEEDFPGLPTSKKPVLEPSGKWKQKETVHKQVVDKQKTVQKQQPKAKTAMYNDSEFPSLGGPSSNHSSNSKWFKPVHNSSNNVKPSRRDSPTDESVPVSERFSPVNVPNSEKNDNYSKNSKKKKMKDKTKVIKEKENIKSNSSLDNIASFLMSNTSNSNSSENINASIQKGSLDDVSRGNTKETTHKSAQEKNQGKTKNDKQLKKEDKIERKLDTERSTIKPVDVEKPRPEYTPAPAPVKFEIGDDEFPTLGAPSKPIRKAPPGFKPEKEGKSVKAPPGLKKAPESAPPPGFGSGRAPKNDTYTQDSVLVSNNVSNFEYAQPDGFSERNKMLIGCIQAYCADDQFKFTDFKILSGEFRKGQSPASMYFKRCQEVLGKNNFLEVFPELLALLPDIEKQHQLLAVFMEKEGMKKDDGVLKISGKSRVAKGAWTVSDSGFLTCQTCKQVLVRNDYNNHVATHSLDSDFPSLGPDAPSQGFRHGAGLRT